MRAKPPCKQPDGTDCPRHYIGCKAECEAWHEWLAEHEKERDEQHKRKRQTIMFNDYRADKIDRLGKRTNGKRVGQR